MMRIIIGLTLAVIGAITAWSLAHSIPASGAFAELKPMLADQCRRVEISPGAEDVTIDPDTNLAFVSAGDRRDWFNATSAQTANPANGIYVIEPGDHGNVRRVSAPMDDFLPHGISLWRGENGEKRLFVVNHPPGGGEFVEIFDVGDGGALTHLESVTFDALISPNDVVGVGPRQFYATNDAFFQKGILATFERYVPMPITNVVYFDGTQGRVAAKGLTFANGVNQSADGKTVYVAELMKRRIAVFDRDMETNMLTRRKNIKVNTAPDNIEVANDGSLWVAGHSKIFDFLKHAKDPAEIAPSHVIRVNPLNELTSNVLVSLDGEINASSVGAVWDNTLIVGGVFDAHVLVCPMMEIFLRGPDT